MNLDDRFADIDKHVSLQALLGYLNFSEGRPDPRFQKQLHDACAFLTEHGSEPWVELPAILRARLQKLKESGSAAFADISQADAVVRLAFEQVLPAYRSHHRDLLAHQSDADLWQPFFLVRVCEAVLNQRGPWQETTRIVQDALRQLNDYVGHRPVPVLENQRRGEIYDHERVRPVPLYLHGVGVAGGRYHDLIERTLQILESTPEPIRTEAYFDLTLMDELAVDPRAYDFGHPADKRPNYCFGEWDPHHIDQQARYRRFVVRQILLDGLCLRVQSAADQDRDERLFEAAAVLAGTMLMASGVSGSGPQVHDSTTTLATLVPRISRYRDQFYADLLPRVEGKHAARLKHEATLLKQPFGGARQALNQFLGQQKALQLQQWHLALLFAQIGYGAAARRQLAKISVTSVRILTEIHVLLTTGRLAIDAGRLGDAAANLAAIEELLKRGIDCGAIADPWIILGLQGQFPRFQALEDSVRDTRIDDLVRVIDQLFDLYGRLLAEGASSGTFTPGKDLANEMRRLAEWWDKFASTTVSDMDHVRGGEATQSAEQVAGALRRWKQRGAAPADLAFWREQLDGFHSLKAFALVVVALLQKQDFRSASALLITWLGQADQIPLAEGEHSFHQLALRWMLGVCLAAKEPAFQPTAVDLVIRFFDILEANAEDLWHVPRLDTLGMADESTPPESQDDEEELYGAAYEGMTFQDSTDDNVEGEVLDAMPQKDFDLMHEAERIEKHLQFLVTLARLWSIATRCLRLAPAEQAARIQAVVANWIGRARHNERELRVLLDKVQEHAIPKPSGEFEALVEFNRRSLAKEQLSGQIIATCLDHRLAIGALSNLGANDAPAEGPAWEPSAMQLERALLIGDTAAARAALPGFIEAFRHEPLLYTPLEQGGDPQLILRSSLAQTILHGLMRNLPRQGMLRETYQLLRLARRMEADQEINGPRTTEFDRLFQSSLRAAVEAVVDAGLHENVAPETLVAALEAVVEPFGVTWHDHSQTVQISPLEPIKQERDWLTLTEFIKRYGRELFHRTFLTMQNVRGILVRGVGAYLHDLSKQPDPLHPLRLIDDLDRSISTAEAEGILHIILQTLLQNYHHLQDYNLTTTQSDYGENLYRLFDFLRLKAKYERVVWLMRPLTLAHDVLARRDGRAAALWRERIEGLKRDDAQRILQDLGRLEREHGIRITTVRDRLEERFVGSMLVDRLCALIEPAVEQARANPENDAIPPLEQELTPLASTPSGVGMEVPPWLSRLENELYRVRTAQSELGNLAESVFHVPGGHADFASLLDQLRDWEKMSLEENQ